LNPPYPISGPHGADVPRPKKIVAARKRHTAAREPHQPRQGALTLPALGLEDSHHLLFVGVALASVAHAVFDLAFSLPADQSSNRVVR
jgi:hypothetical protein